MTQTPTPQIQEARSKIDEWVRSRPPALHFARFVELPVEKDRVPAAVAKLLDSTFPIWREVELFELATKKDAQRTDGLFFDGRRQALLDVAFQLLSAALETTLRPEQKGAALTTQAYGEMQFLLWYLHVGGKPDLPVALWESAGDLANRGWQLQKAAAMEEADWIDTAIRVQLVSGWASIAVGNIRDALQHFFFLISWYASADQLGHKEVVRNRHSDWLQALYGIIDHATEESTWRVTASALVKDLRIGRYRVKPPAVASPSAIESGKLDLNFNFSLAGPEWGLAFSRLGTTSAFLDLVITDKFIHAYFYRSQTTRHIRNELPLVTRPAPAGETPRGSYQISPASAVLEPVDDEKRLELFALTEQWHPQEHRSLELRWASHFQKMRIHCIDDLWSWDFQWVTSYPTFEKNLWHAIYQSAFAEVIPLCDKLGINHLIVSPDGSLNAMPLHLLPDDEGTRLGTKIAISYLPNVTGILNILDVDNLSFDNVSFIVVKDPTRTVGMAEWECQSVASIAGRRAQIIPSHEATVERIKELSQGAGVLHFTGHATFAWTDPDSAYLTAAGNERIGLADLRELRFQPGALVFLSACHSGRHSMGGERSASRGIVSALLEAGAASVVCTLWPIDSPAAALVAYWFYEALIRERKARLEALQQATKKLREATRSECEQILGRRIFRRGERPFEDEYYWGAYVLYGAW